MPAVSDKERGFMGLVKSYKLDPTTKIDKNRDAVIKVANSMSMDQIDDFLKKETAGVEECGSGMSSKKIKQEANMMTTKNKSKYTGTAPLGSSQSCDTPTSMTPVSTPPVNGDLIDPEDVMDTPKAVKTVELPDKMVKKFLYLIRDMSGNINEAQFNGKTVKLFVPFKIKHPVKKYGIYIKSMRDGRIIKVIFGTKDMQGDPLFKSSNNEEE